MDKGGKEMDNSNMSSIPIYALYGEATQDQSQDWLHWETLLSRSRLYDFRIAPHRHEQFFQIIHITAGTAVATIDNETFSLGPDSAICIPALTVHGYEFSPDIVGVVLTLFERDVRSILAQAPEIAEAFRVPRAIRGSREVGRTVDELIAEASRREPGRAATMPARIGLLLVAIHRAEVATAHRAQASASRSVHHVQAFQELADTEFANARPMAFYAGALGITPTHLNRVCRQVLGASALSVIERRVALEAKRYLMFSSLSVKEIALLLGYQDPAYFNRFFSRQVGMAPGVFRKSVRTGEEGAAPLLPAGRPG
ncbi:helix-turn-helix domain-containing protein [Paradevosia shaoguanensis]|uniref:Helix-turn-helix domain-containing protein n=1 Tax=Paradevosia shaoguanensis TaxID=1335043 RepID=A0AA41QMN9_9HYPH|nr:helix-turn-helix domain-containing protein [Paradevosia shaoguanensis]MCF1742480.1 helix-turn-helix domain-containing protein [Paradevosia shaoguanensis]MCI0126963.1 helix-turn-helix domain-containing protein [Paradevosia shaoguanensis]